MPLQSQQPAAQGTPAPIPGAEAPATAAEMYQAMRAQKDVLEAQLRDQQRVREGITGRLRSSEIVPADRAGLEARLVQVDARIAQIDAQLATADQQVALAAAQPGAIVRQPPDPTEDVLEVVAVVSVIFMFVAVLPLSIAWARRIWKKHAVTINLPEELTSRLVQIERGVEATAIEVERIGEGQRFVTQLLANKERAQPVSLPPGTPPA